MNKKQAGRLGGKATANRYGSDYMANIGRKGAVATHNRYRLQPIGISAWAMTDRATGQVKAIIGNLPIPLTSGHTPIDNNGL